MGKMQKMLVDRSLMVTDSLRNFAELWTLTIFHIHTHTLLKKQSIGAGDDSAGGGDRKDHGWIAAWLEYRGATWIRSSCMCNPEAMRLDEINVLQASLTYSDELPADPEMEAECGQAWHMILHLQIQRVSHIFDNYILCNLFVFLLHLVHKQNQREHTCLATGGQ